ncbi:MAG: translocation/assembly module TamB domain-containing protein [Acidobacteria bacterium]|nr:translocation/assembly module TamB domain-containing protein [Acidobacteriota bacterium]
MKVRRIGMVVAALAAGAVALVLLAHAPLVRNAALRYALATVPRDYGLTVDAARLDYNLAALRVGLAGIRLSAAGSTNEPFLEADYLSVTLPLGALFGDVAFKDITVTNARAFVHRRTDGTTNLPDAEDGPGDQPPALRIGRLDIPRLAIDVRDEQADIALRVPAIALLLVPDEGSVSLEAPADLRVGTRATRISQLRGQAAFDGRALRLGGTELRAAEASLTLEGSFLLVTREPRVDLNVSGTGDIARLARWGLMDEELPQGEMAFDGTVTGPLGDPLAQLEMRAERLSWRGVATTDLAARMRVGSAAAEVQELRFALAEGTATAAALLPFASDARGRATASWTRVSAASAILAVVPDTDLVPSAFASGQLDVEGILSDASTWSGSLRLQMTPGQNARGRIAMAGNLTLDLRDGTWRLAGQPRLAGVAPIRIAAGGRLADGGGGGPEGPSLPGPPPRRALASSVAGTVQLSETDLPALLAALSAAGIADITGDAVVSGSLEADIELGGSLADPSVSGRAMARDLAGPRFAVQSVTVGFSGRPFQPRLDFSIAAPEADVAGQRLQAVRATGVMTGTSIVLAALSASQPGGAGVVTGNGDYDLDTGEFTASIDGAEWQLAATAEQPLAGRLTIRFAGSGTAEEPRGEGQVALADAMWQGQVLGDLAASVQLDGQAAHIALRAPDFDAAATARIQLDAPYAALIDARTGRLDLARVLRDLETPTPMAGSTSLALRFAGPLDAWRTGSADVEVVSLDATAGVLPIRLARPARLRYEAEHIVVDSLEVDAGGTRVSVSGELPAFEPARDTSGMLVTLTGGVGEVARAAAATGFTQVPITGGNGPVALLARVTGSLQTPVVAADLEVGPGSITLQELPPLSGVRFRAHAEGGWLDVREGAASFQDADITVRARAPLSWVAPSARGARGDAVLRVRAINLTPAILAPFLDATAVEQLTGSVDATLDLASATPELSAVTGELRVDRLEVRVADLPVSQRVPTRIVARDGFARVEAWDWVGQGATLAVRGQMRLEDREAAILANGVVDLRLLTPFVRNAGMTTAGRLEPRLSITGTLENPRIDGDLTVTGGEIRLVDPRILVSDLTARAVLTRTSANITSLTGTSNGGTLTGRGALDYGAGGGLAARLSTTVRGMALEFPEGLRSEVDADLDLELDLLRPSGRLTGTVAVVRGSYREPLAVVTGLLAGMRADSLAAGAGAASAASSRLLEALMLDVRLLSDEDAIIDNNYGRFQLGADLRAIGTAARPALAGRAELREGGRLFFGRNVYTIKSGTIDFANPVTIEPILDLDATTRAGGEDIELRLQGTPADLDYELSSSSTPELGEADLTSLLLTGRRFDDLAPDDAAFVGTQVLGNFSGELLGFASRAVGLDTLRLGGPDTGALRRDSTAFTTELDPTTRLTFGKSLRPDVDLTFSQSLRDSDAQTWVVEYLPARGLELRLVSDDDDLRSYGFRHDVAFGGPGRAARTAAAARQAQGGRVAAVHFSGEFVLPEARLREVVRLAPGDRFDFAEWQADRDRLGEVYRREGYLTARVTPNRSDGPEGITLDFQIVAGPETRIVVTGIDLSQALRSRLETAWVQSIVDDFLVDEAAQIVREDLARGSYLRPTIDARVLEEDNRRTLFVTVDRGGRTARTIVRVEGVDETLAGGITARLAERGLVDEAGSNVAAVEREVAAYLRMTGHLRARVTVGAPLFEVDEAVVPVSVDAGPVFSIARVTFEGAERLPDDVVREAVALTDGAAYDPAGVDAARDRLVALYRREGFPSAAVTARPAIRTDAPAVEITFLVSEGARQVLGEVVVAGNRAIDSDVIVRALGLQPDAPLRAEEVLRARTRIFSTGLFRRVDVASEELASPKPGEGGAPGDGRVVSVRLRITVEEWPALRLRYGFQVAEERPEASPEGREVVPGLSADLTRRTLFGRAITTGGVAELQRRERLGRVFINTGTLFGLPVGSSLLAERSREEFTAVSLVTSRSRVTWEQRARVAGNLSLSYAYTFERNHTFDTKTSDPGSLAFDITINIARVNAAAAWDTRDDPVDTARGSLASFSLEYAPEAVGSDIRFVRQVAQGYHFRSWRRLVFASAARLGAVVPLGGQELILSERFFAGGARTVRGVAEGGLGARDFFGDPAGGRMLAVFNQEVRLPVYRWLRGVGFVDAGNVFARPRDASLRDLVGSIGFGLRVASPFALLRSDFARPIWGRPESSWQWSVGIGHAF